MVAGSLLATPFEYDDHWPNGTTETETEVVVPDGKTATISTADDVARVERLTSISIGSGAVVKYTASTAMTLSAALSGTGAFIGKDSALLTIAADNSGLAAPGHFAFTNAQVLVSHEDGLGAAATGRADFMFDSNSLLDFVVNANGVYTNKVQMKVNVVGTSTGKLRIGVSPRTGRLVQCADFVGTSANGGQKSMYIDGSMEFVGCKISNSPDYLYFIAKNGVSHLWFSEGVTFSSRFCLFAYDSNLKVHLDGSCPTTIGFTYTRVYCERENTLTNMTGYPYTSSILDLQGGDQTMKCFENDYCGGKPTASTGVKFYVTSESPAMLTLSSNATRTNAVMFTGAAGYCHDNTRTHAICGAVSTSTNLLDVAKGRVALIWGAGWSGDVTVRADATLEISSANGITGGDRRLVVEPTGKLIINAGAVCNVASALLGATELLPGRIYTVAKLRDEMELPVDGDDNAQLTVSGNVEWNGWPASGTALVPADTTVYIGDADVASVNGLDAIELMPGSMVACTNWTTPLALTPPLVGSGMFVADSTAPIVLNGSNIGLQTPGTFCFTNTDVIVSNRYGLGSVGTAMATFHRGSGNHNLRFGGPGLVCDAPIQYASTVSNNKGNIGPDSAGETLIFSNSFRLVGTNPSFSFRNRIRFSGGTFGVYGNNHIYSHKAADSEIVPEIWFDSGVKVRVYFWFASDCVYHLGWDAVEWVDKFVTYTGGSKAICESANALKVIGNYASWGNANYLDLNGIDQSLSNIDGGNYHVAGEAIVVTSSVPACVKITNKTTDKNLLTNSVCFRAAAAYTQGAACTNTFKTFFSTTTGPLTVETGGLRLTSGAGWGGTNVLVKSGATLLVDASSMSVAFGNRTTQGHLSRTKLTIERGGTLDLAAAESPAVVRTLVYDGAIMPAGRYTSASGVGITGDGALYVRSSTDGEPGAMIIIY